jgi:hypothetical protein
MSSIYPVQWLTDGSQRIAQVWRGAINSLDNALRLLLIMDYILDWARDIYREGVIRSLRRLAASDSRSLAYQDSDVFSTVTGVTRVERWVAAEQHGAESNWPEEQEAAGINDAFRSFDTKNAVLRDIRYIQSRFVGLHVAEDNLGAFLKSTTTEQGSKKLALSLLTHLLEGWRVKGETLTAVESDWTGKDRGLEQRDQEATFFMAATVAAYLTPDWEQTRELSYIAIEEGAVDRLLKYAGLKLADGHKLSDFPFVDKTAFCDILLVLRRQPAGANLLACISRVCLSTGILSSENDEHKDVLSVTSVEKSDQGITEPTRCSSPIRLPRGTLSAPSTTSTGLAEMNLSARFCAFHRCWTSWAFPRTRRGSAWEISSTPDGSNRRPESQECLTMASSLLFRTTQPMLTLWRQGSVSSSQSRLLCARVAQSSKSW